MIWAYFNQFITSVRDTSTASSVQSFSTPPTDLPYILGSDIGTLLGLSSQDCYDFPKANYLERVLDMLGYPVADGDPTQTVTKFYNSANGIYKDTHFNPFRLFALARLYWDWYRQTDYEPVYDPKGFNLDNLASGGNASVNLTQIWNDFMYRPYVNWGKDIFTNLKPSPVYSQFASVNTYVPSSDVSSGPTYGGASAGNTTGEFFNGKAWVAAASAGAVTTQIEYISNTQGLRNALALDKLARLSQLAPKTYAAQMKAHFGVEPDGCDYCSSRYLGSYDNFIDIGEVLATAAGADGSGSTSSVGEIYGRGVGSGKMNRPIKTEFKEHGIVMGLYSCTPSAAYDSMRIDLFNTKLTRQDYYQPEFDSLGMQLMSQFQVNADSNPSNVIGYVPRYCEYKSRPDEIHSTFQSHGINKSWTTSRTFQYKLGALYWS